MITILYIMKYVSAKLNKSEFVKKVYYLKLVYSIVFLSAFLYLNTLMSRLISQYFPNRPILDDLMFHILPYIEYAQYLSDIVLILAIVALLFHSIKKRGERIAFLYFAIWASRAFESIFSIAYFDG